MNKTLISTFSLGLALFATLAHAQDTPAQDAKAPEREAPKVPYVPLYGTNTGVHSFLDEKTRKLFGDMAISFSPGLGPTFAKKGLSIMPDVSFLYAQKEVAGSKNRMLMMTLGPSFRYGLVQPAEVSVVDGEPKIRFKMFAPFIEGGVNLVYVDAKARAAGIDAKELTYAGTFAVGTSITKNASLKLKVQMMPKIDGYDFSTASLEFGIRF